MGQPTAGNGSTILVVDDDPSVLAMLRAVLESEGHSVVSASSAADARTKLENGTFDLVITDMRMETETSGFDVIRAARRRPEAPAILVLTAYPMREEVWREAGAHAGLMKGMPIGHLTGAVHRLLATRKQSA